MWAVRSYIIENDEEVFMDEGPLDRYFAELLLADIGVDASVQRGLLARATVTRAIIIPAEEADF